MRPVLRDRLAAGETVTGLILFSASPMILEVAAAAGVDFVIIDMEHTAVDMDRVGHLIRAADAAGMTPFGRVPKPDAALIKKLLNLGATGICLPHADRAGCEQTLRAVRYAPQGDRGACAIVRSAGYAPGDWDAYTARANRDVMVIPLLEGGDVLGALDYQSDEPFAFALDDVAAGETLAEFLVIALRNARLYQEARRK